jgi:hypothetical protein
MKFTALAGVVFAVLAASHQASYAGCREDVGMVIGQHLYGARTPFSDYLAADLVVSIMKDASSENFLNNPRAWIEPIVNQLPKMTRRSQYTLFGGFGFIRQHIDRYVDKIVDDFRALDEEVLDYASQSGATPEQYSEWIKPQTIDMKSNVLSSDIIFDDGVAAAIYALNNDSKELNCSQLDWAIWWRALTVMKHDFDIKATRELSRLVLQRWQADAITRVEMIRDCNALLDRLLDDEVLADVLRVVIKSGVYGDLSEGVKAKLLRRANGSASVKAAIASAGG